MPSKRHHIAKIDIERLYPSFVKAVRADDTLQTPQLLIGEIPVDIRVQTSCGEDWWYGHFPDKSRCCQGPHNPDREDYEWGHETRNEAILCSRLKAASGFTMRLPGAIEDDQS